MTILLDTHILVWLLNGSERIGEPVHAQIQQAADEDSLFISAITPWEIAMLVAKGRLRLGKDVEEWIRAALSLPGIRLEPLRPQSRWPAPGFLGRSTQTRRIASCWQQRVIWTLPWSRLMERCWTMGRRDLSGALRQDDGT